MRHNDGYFVNVERLGAGVVSEHVNLPPAVPVSHMGTPSNPRYSTSDLAPCWWPGETVEDGSMPWALAPHGWQRGSWLWAFDQLSSSHVGNELAKS